MKVLFAWRWTPLSWGGPLGDLPGCPLLGAVHDCWSPSVGSLLHSSVWVAGFPYRLAGLSQSRAKTDRRQASLNCGVHIFQFSYYRCYLGVIILVDFLVKKQAWEPLE